MRRKLGINTDCFAGINEITVLEMAKSHGFEAITTSLTNVNDVCALKNRADTLGVEFGYLHAPFRGINTMWETGDSYRNIYSGMLEAITSASECGVKAVVTHVSSGWSAPCVNDLGLSRFDDLVEFATKKGVVLAFENLRKVGNLATLMDRYEKSDNVRFCFDCGHEHCYTKTVSWIDIFTDKLIATHIHDNLGRDLHDKVSDNDSHWLPFDGNYNYHKMMRRLDKYGYSGPLLLEVFNTTRGDYSIMSGDEFLKTCYDRINRISRL